MEEQCVTVEGEEMRGNYVNGSRRDFFFSFLSTFFSLHAKY